MPTWIKVIGSLVGPDDLPTAAEENSGYVVINDLGDNPVHHLWAFQGGTWVDTNLVMVDSGSVVGDNPIPPETSTLIRANAYTDEKIADLVHITVGPDEPVDPDINDVWIVTT